MIRYNLRCKKDHAFDVWFRNSDDFDRQQERGLVSCPVCGVKKIEKSLMAPSVVTSKSSGRGQDISAPAGEPDDHKAVSDRPVMAAQMPEEMMAAMRDLRRKVEKTAENVGDKFAEEARRIHHKETEERSIYGKASLKEAKELVDEGIEFMPLPRLPEDEN